MDGCHWINCDIGILGTKYGETMLIKYLELIEKLKEANIIIEKFHLTEAVYQKLYYQRDFDFNKIDNRLKKINAKIILSTFDEDAALLKHRLRDRLKHYPHYQKIAQQPRDYIEQQKLYLKLLESSQLEHLIVNTSKLPDQKIIDDILHFLKEK
jgi:thymidylate kinase